MEDIQKSIQNMNMSKHIKIKMDKFIKSQLKNNCEKLENSLKNEYICNKCRDLTFIIKDNEAIPCKCRALR